MTSIHRSVLLAWLAFALTACGDDGGSGDGDPQAGSGGLAGLAGGGSGGASGAAQGGRGGTAGAAGACDNRVLDPGEVDVDCGGDCDRCDLGDRCEVDLDCVSGVCGEAGICVECVSAESCPGDDTACSARSCVDGTCGTVDSPAGTAVESDDAAGDCQRPECDGSGEVVSAEDASDLPDDDNPCTVDACDAGAPSHEFVARDVSCGTDLICDGAGHCVGCTGPAQCPGTDTECRTRTCTDDVCGFSYRASGTATATQVAGDCKVNECDGSGNLRVASLDTDLPTDANPCTDARCSAGTPSQAPSARAEACGDGLVCDGASHCVDCLAASECPGQSNGCQSPICTAQGVCDISRVAAGTPLDAQVPGDCKADQCNGEGSTVTVDDDLDLPNDGNVCTVDVCTDGTPSNPPVALGEDCGEGRHCDGAGRCVECVTASECPGQDSACEQRTCSAAGVCGVNQLQNGTPIAAQVPGDCHIARCDGEGGEFAAVDDEDVPVDGNFCTTDVCTAGTPSNPPLSQGEACGESGECDGAGRCIGCNVAADCDGVDTACRTRVCVNNQCDVETAPDGTPVADPTAGDCRGLVCDAQGNAVVTLDDEDVLVDGSDCTQDVCAGGIASNPDVAPGAPCEDGVCDGAGLCVECLVAADCGPPVPCQTRVCSAAHTCGIQDVAEGTPVGAQTAGDCRVLECDGQGQVRDAADDDDVGIDTNPCTGDACEGGSPSHPPRSAGVSCGGTNACDGASHCCPAGAAYCDDFEDGDAAGWTQVEQSLSTPGVWTVASEAGHEATTLDFQQTSLAVTYHYQLANVTASGGPYQDQTVTAWIKPNSPIGGDATKAGICARFSGVTNAEVAAYCLFIRSDGNAGGGRLQMSKKLPGGSQSTIDGTTVATNVPALQPGTWYKVTLTVSGSAPVALTGSINDVPLIVKQDATDPILSGGPALVTRQAQASFDDVLVSSP